MFTSFVYEALWGAQHWSMNPTLPPCFQMLCAASATFFEFASLANFSGKICYLSHYGCLTLWNCSQNFRSLFESWICNWKNTNKCRKKMPFGPVKTCFEDENFLNFTEARLAGETSSGIRRSSFSISSFRLTGWPNCLTCVASVKRATFMQSEVTSPKNHWHPTHPDQTNDPVQYSDPS